MSISIVPQLVNWEGGNRKGSYITYEESEAQPTVIKNNSGVSEEYKLFYTNLECGQIDIELEGGVSKTINGLALREITKSVAKEFEERLQDKISTYQIIAIKSGSNSFIVPGSIQNLRQPDDHLAIEKDGKMNLMQDEKNTKGTIMDFALYYKIREAFGLQGTVQDVFEAFMQDNASVELPRIEEKPQIIANQDNRAAVKQHRRQDTPRISEGLELTHKEEGCCVIL